MPGEPIPKLVPLEAIPSSSVVPEASADDLFAETPVSESPEPAPNDWLSAVTAPPALWGWMTLLLVIGVTAPFIPVPTDAIALVSGISLTLIYVAAMIGIAVSVGRRQLSMPELILALLIAIAWWALGQFIGIDRIIEPFNDRMREHGGAPAWQQLFIARIVRQLTALALILAATFGGNLVGRLIKSRNMLGPICAMIALIDIWGVLFGGIVSKLMTNPVTKAASQKAFAGLPQIGAQVSGGARVQIPMPDIGAGDYLFLGLLFAVLVHLGMNWRGAARLTYPLVAVALLAIAFGVPALPGLLFIGLGVAIPNLKYFRFTRDERFALLYAGILVIFLTGGLYFMLLHQFPPPPPSTT